MCRHVAEVRGCDCPVDSFLSSPYGEAYRYAVAEAVMTFSTSRDIDAVRRARDFLFPRPSSPAPVAPPAEPPSPAGISLPRSPYTPTSDSGYTTDSSSDSWYTTDSESGYTTDASDSWYTTDSDSGFTDPPESPQRSFSSGSSGASRPDSAQGSSSSSSSSSGIRLRVRPDGTLPRHVWEAILTVSSSGLDGDKDKDRDAVQRACSILFPRPRRRAASPHGRPGIFLPYIPSGNGIPTDSFCSSSSGSPWSSQPDSPWASPPGSPPVSSPRGPWGSPLPGTPLGSQPGSPAGKPPGTPP